MTVEDDMTEYSYYEARDGQIGELVLTRVQMLAGMRKDEELRRTISSGSKRVSANSEAMRGAVRQNKL
jgi:hypothetical protein